MEIAVSSLVCHAHSTITIITGLLGIAEQGSIKVWSLQKKDEEGLKNENFNAKIKLVPAGTASIVQTLGKIDEVVNCCGNKSRKSA